MKILYSLKGTNWIMKRSAIEEAKDLALITFEGLMGKLKAFDVQMQLDESMAPKIGLKLDANK